MVFVSFTARISAPRTATLDPQRSAGQDWIPVKIPTLLLVNTFVFAISVAWVGAGSPAVSRRSSSCVRRHCFRSFFRENKMLGRPDTDSGTLFLFGPVDAWPPARRIRLFTFLTPSSSFVYLLTGTHAVHLMGGVLALSWPASPGYFEVATRSI